MKKKMTFIFLLFLVLSSCTNRPLITGEAVLELGERRTEENVGYLYLGVPNSFIDLDRGLLGNIEEADFWYGRDTSAKYFIGIGYGVNGAILQNLGNLNPNFENCLKILDDFEYSEYSFRGRYVRFNFITTMANPGEYYCVETNEGNISLIMIAENFGSEERHKMKIEYITWEVKVD